MDQTQEEDEALAHMRRSVQVLGSSAAKYGDPTLLRFLKARSMDVEKASKMFVQWGKWRETFVPLNYIPECEVEDELSAEKIYLQGLSRTGNPLVIVKANKHFPSKDQLQFKRFVVYLLDKTIASGIRGKEIGNEKLMGIIDLKGMSFKNVDARGLITGFQFLQAYYPERLSKCYILHMPRFFVSVWRLVSRFIDKATLEKVVIVSNEEERKEMVRNIGEQVLPEEYGGRAQVVPIQDFALASLEDDSTLPSECDTN